MALIFFDFDGVLVDSLSANSEQFVAACHSIGIDSVNSSDDMSKLSEGNFYQGLLDMGISQEKVDQALKIYSEKIQSPDFHLPTYEPVFELLKKLAQEYPLYIVTSNVSFMVERVMGENGVHNVRDVLGIDKEPSKIKKFQKVMAQYPGEKTLFVSDTKGDILEAKEADIDVRIGVTWGWQKPWIVASGNPDYIFDDFQCLTAWFAGYLRATK